MALGRRRSSHQSELFVTSADLPQSPGHAFYDRLNALLAEAEFDRFVEDLCRPHYADEVGCPSLSPGTYFRMLFVGYFEGLDSQRAIAWRCADSLSLRTFLGIPFDQASPDHSSLTRIRKRLPQVIHERGFALVLAIAHEQDLLRGRTVDSTTLEANAAMRAIVRKDIGEDLRQFDRTRKKKASNEDWKSATDADSRIARMKEGRTHLAYKAEHAVDLDSGLVLAAAVHPADEGDATTLVDSVLRAQINLVRADVEEDGEEVAANKGYHKSEALATCADWVGGRTSRNRSGRSGRGPTSPSRGVGLRRRTAGG